MPANCWAAAAVASPPHTSSPSAVTSARRQARVIRLSRMFPLAPSFESYLGPQLTIDRSASPQGTTPVFWRRPWCAEQPMRSGAPPGAGHLRLDLARALRLGLAQALGPRSPAPPPAPPEPGPPARHAGAPCP